MGRVSGPPRASADSSFLHGAVEILFSRARANVVLPYLGTMSSLFSFFSLQIRRSYASGLFSSKFLHNVRGTRFSSPPPSRGRPLSNIFPFSYGNSLRFRLFSFSFFSVLSEGTSRADPGLTVLVSFLPFRCFTEVRSSPPLFERRPSCSGNSPLWPLPFHRFPLPKGED